jgi:small-conductance mechanosensitive channel
MERIIEVAAGTWAFVVYTTPTGNAVSVGQLVLVGLLMLLGIYGGRLAQRFVARRLEAVEFQPDAAHAIERILFYAVIAAVLMTVLTLLHIPLTAFAFISGAVAIAVGFGAQNILNNFISGWILMSERPVRMGDVIEIGGSYGTVEAIGARSTRIRRIDGVHLLVPNSHMLENTVVNWTLVDTKIRTSVRVGVAYGSPVKLVAELIRQAVTEQPDVIEDPEPQIIFDDFGDSALIFDVYFWSDVGAERQLRQIRSAVRFRLTELFAENGITIPFPQRDVHLIDAAAGAPAPERIANG